MKQLTKQSMKELIKYALELPVGDLEKYGNIFLSGPLPTNMTRGELIALQLIERASYGDLDAVKELRQWVVEDPKSPTAGGTNYFQFLTVIAEGGKVPDNLPPVTAEGFKTLVKTIEAKASAPPQNDLLDDLDL